MIYRYSRAFRSEIAASLGQTEPDLVALGHVLRVGKGRIPNAPLLQEIYTILYGAQGGAEKLFASLRRRIDFRDAIRNQLFAPIGFFLGRIANFINGELYGKVSNLPWAVIFPDSGNVGRHPSQIYEAILEGIVLFVLINYFALKKQLLFKPGYVSGLFLAFYSILRIFSEIFREPDIHLGYFFNYFSLGVLLSIITLIVGLLIIFLLKKNE